MPQQIMDRIIPVSLEDEMSESYGRYARYTILSRAIPDVRDGLKPVQRRIIYAKYEARNLDDRPYRKCAKTVGDVMGNYHPHGDQSIYDALVRMAQWWKMGHPLVDGHGNFGSMDDDPPAAMRYTESRLAPLARTLLQDIEKQTVPFAPNFDQSQEEPTVLPSRLPNLLINGCSGVSTGFATEVPPHNLRETMEAALLLSRKPGATTHELCQIVPGPDFPTGGIIVNGSDLEKMYERGKGKVILRAKTRIEPRPKTGGKRIVVDELPYGVIKSNLVAQLDQERLSSGVQGISDVRDESDREGLRIVIDLDKGAHADGILNYLLKKTHLQVSLNVQMMAIARGAPRQLRIREILECFLDHRREVITRRSAHDLEASQKRLHQVEGLIRALDLLDEVIVLIRSSRDRGEAHRRLIAELEFSAEQADAILELRLHRLTNLQLQRLLKEQGELNQQIERLNEILQVPRTLERLLRSELREVIKKHARERRTEITDAATKPPVSLSVTVPRQRIRLALTEEGYLKRCSLRGEPDPTTAGARPGDFLRWTSEAWSTDRLLLFLDDGTYAALRVHELPEARWSERGTALVNLTSVRNGQKVVGCLPISSFEDEGLIALATHLGKIKLTSLKTFQTTRSTCIAALRLADDDKLVKAMPAKHSGDLLLVTFQGMAIRFPASDVPVQGRAASGVKGIALAPDDHVVELLHAPMDSATEITIFTTTGRGKRTPLKAYPVQSRGGRGTRTVKRLMRRAHQIAAAALAPSEAEAWWICTSSGQISFLRSNEIPPSSRDGNVSGILKLEPGETFSHCAVDPRRCKTSSDPERDADPNLSTSKSPLSKDPETPNNPRSTQTGTRASQEERGTQQLSLLDDF